MPFSTIPKGFAAIEPSLQDRSHARVVVLPIPYDMTTSYGSGARFGPAAIIAASQHMETFDEDALREFCEVGIHTSDPLSADSRGPEHMIGAVEAAAALWHQGEKFVLGLGGEHSVSFGLVRAAQQRFGEIGVLQLDAHLDLRSSYEESPYNHACVMRRIHEDLQLPIAQVGIRSYCAEENTYVQKHGLKPLSARQLMTADGFTRSQCIVEAIEQLPEKIYLTLDLDVLDPAILPATGTPEPGGLDWYTVLEVVATACARRHVVSADLVELAPIGGQLASDFLAAKLAYKIIGHAVALRGN